MKADPALLYTHATDSTRQFLEAAHQDYREDVRWSAPARGVTRRGRDHLIAELVSEAAAMQDARFTRLRCSNGETRCIDEYSVLFTCGAGGIVGAPISPGDLVELNRVRILDLLEGQVAKETCIETWSILARNA